MDDSIFRKTGKKTHGVAYRRDPLGPPFRVNFIRGQRFLQISAALPQGPQIAAARMIPIDFCHCPTPKKPPRNASLAQKAHFQQLKKETNISQKGLERIKALRQVLDSEAGGQGRALVVSVDGGYTNGTVLKGLPHNTILIGRIRKDAKLHHPPTPPTKTSRGRKRVYGPKAPTPEELRQDEKVNYQKIRAWATGKHHHFKVKTIAPVLWPTAGKGHSLRLIVIAPLAYRLTKCSPILYRQPAYLICTAPNLSLQDILQWYLWRWGIEVNFRDEKHILGAGQAQVRGQRSVENVPALIIATYSIFLLAAHQAFGDRGKSKLLLPKPKWRKDEKTKPPSTQDLINQLRAEMWGESMGLNNFSGFVTNNRPKAKPEKSRPNLASAVLYACA